jgi:hypothetical protein
MYGMKTNVNLKFKMGAALMATVLGLGLGAVGTAQAKDVVLKEMPSNFHGAWQYPNGSEIYIASDGIGGDNMCGIYRKIVGDPSKPNKVTLTWQDKGLDCDIKKAPVVTSVLLLKGNRLSITGKKGAGLNGTYRKVAD